MINICSSSSRSIELLWICVKIEIFDPISNVFDGCCLCLLLEFTFWLVTHYQSDKLLYLEDITKDLYPRHGLSALTFVAGAGLLLHCRWARLEFCVGCSLIGLRLLVFVPATYICLVDGQTWPI